MKTMLFSLLAMPLLASLPSRTPASSAATQAVPGGFQVVDCDSSDVLEAKATVQKALPALTIQAVLEAYQQVVAGINFKLICRVSDSSGTSTWEFIVWHRLDDTWKLTSARLL